MTWEMAIIAAFRIAGSLPVLRWAFAGAFVAMLTDLGDLFLREGLDLGGVKDYQRFDKWLDQVYMLTFLAVALRWEPIPRNIAVALYVFRMIGFVAFEIDGRREILLFFPNVFEYWFVFVAGLKFFGLEEGGRRKEEEGMPDRVKWMPGLRLLFPFRYSRGQLAVSGSVVLAAKLFHEYMLHYGQWFESFTAFEAVEAIWDFVTGPLG